MEVCHTNLLRGKCFLPVPRHSYCREKKLDKKHFGDDKPFFF